MLDFRLDPSAPKKFYIRENPTFDTYTLDYNRRMTFWKIIFADIPPTIHLLSSKTWKNPNMYLDKATEQVVEFRDEL